MEVERVIEFSGAGKERARRWLKWDQTGLRMSVVMMFILSYMQCSNAHREFSREDAFVGYSEHIPKKYFDPGSHAIRHEYLVLKTQYGDIKVRLATLDAPHTVAYIKSLVNRGLTKGCSFYRAEPVGPTIDEGHDGYRQGYALVQGGLYSCGRQETKKLPLESALNITKGSASLITGTSEFFFSLEAHPEWNGSFSVWGEVVGWNSWHTLQKIVVLPTRQETHSSGTVLRMLLHTVIFDARLEFK